MYRIFFGAPRASDIDNDPNFYQWETVSSKPNTKDRSVQSFHSNQSIILPPAALEAASRRISLMYENAIFDNTEQHLYEEETSWEEFRQRDETTTYTWPPTNQDISKNYSSASFLDISKSGHTSADFGLYQTQDTRVSQSYEYSDASSIARFPDFHFHLHSLISLTSLRGTNERGSRKISTLLAVLEVDGPTTVKIKRGPDIGKEVSMLSLVLGDEDGTVCKLTAWRGVADAWGGGEGMGVKRGDIIYIENVVASWDPTTSPALTASPFQKSKMQICYRTMPYTHEDNSLRPDLRLGVSDAAVRKVTAVVRWFEKIAGLTTR